MSSKIKDLKKAETNVQSLIKKLNDYAKDIYAVRDQINAMMKGDGTSAYWEGQNAIGWYSDAIVKVNKLMGNYENSVKAITSFAKKVEKAERKSKIPAKTPKAAAKMILEGITGSKYTASLKNKTLVRMSTAIPGTVGSNVASDDKNQASYKCFRTLKASLDEICKDCSNMSATWDKLANVTTGDLHTTAKNRSKYIGERKRETANVKTDLDETYLGDLLFS